MDDIVEELDFQFWLLIQSTYMGPLFMCQTLGRGCHRGTKQMTVPALWKLTANPASYLNTFLFCEMGTVILIFHNHLSDTIKALIKQ